MRPAKTRISLGIQSVRMKNVRRLNHTSGKIGYIYYFSKSYNGARDLQNFMTIFNNILTVIHASLF